MIFVIDKHCKRVFYALPLFLSIILLPFCSKDSPPSLLFNLSTKTQVKGSLTGWVTDTAGKALSSVNVFVGTGLTTFTLPDGKFTIPDIPAGTYSLTLKRYSYQDTVITNVVMEIGQDQLLKENLIMRSAKAAIRGVVYDSKHNPVIGAGLTIAGQPYVSITGVNGDFIFPEVICGHITAVASRKGIGWGEAVIDIKPGEIGSVEIILNQQGGSIKGRVINEQGGTVNGAVVIAMAGGVTDTTDMNGEYFLTNLPSSIPLQ